MVCFSDSEVERFDQSFDSGPVGQRRFGARRSFRASWREMKVGSCLLPKAAEALLHEIGDDETDSARLGCATL